MNPLIDEARQILDSWLGLAEGGVRQANNLGEIFQYWFEHTDGVRFSAGNQLRYLQFFIICQMLIATDPKYAEMRTLIEVPARFDKDGSLPAWLETVWWDNRAFDVRFGGYSPDDLRRRWRHSSD